MKFVTAAALSFALAAPAFAGGMAEPIMEEEVVAEETAASSNAGILVPILALILIGLAISNNGDDPVTNGATTAAP